MIRVNPKRRKYRYEDQVVSMKKNKGGGYSYGFGEIEVRSANSDCDPMSVTTVIMGFRLRRNP